ncbi:nucleotide exchange factor GrpE [Candidatus Berkelbacteria bacterium CG10_big_fil_rev_8_21_14_0_10_43_13]|uniref:Protein GrpE n=1 Tax=Candidatus Berkelbacteria bacterium CG10_big_fil_rev_8_21_14_0_10_43_13 TaxID=1974514 RepID=A0A2H0W6J4_9BACT|nr:MAG: nucleotide exchange factor GrpE [Candidatus Berkelbacteria bacterium CG10_big_fil_rev_8_21_14_0_10_43_13]
MPKEKKQRKLDPNIELEQKIAELTAGWQRTQADFTNFRRATELDRQKLAEITKADVLLEILPVLDNFQLAAKHIPVEIENDNWVSGIKQIEKQLESILTSVGLEKIPTIGNQFDHNLHEAIESISSEKPESEIVEEIQSGYKLNSNVIRPAKVKVSAGSEKKK